MTGGAALARGVARRSSFVSGWVSFPQRLQRRDPREDVLPQQAPSPGVLWASNHHPLPQVEVERGSVAQDPEHRYPTAHCTEHEVCQWQKPRELPPNRRNGKLRALSQPQGTGCNCSAREQRCSQPSSDAAEPNAAI